MDDAENQKAEVERIKQSVSDNFRSRRAFRITKKEAGPSRVVQAAKLTSEVGSSLQDDDIDQNASNFDQLRIDDWRGTAVSLPLVEPWPTTSNSPGMLLTHGSEDVSKATTRTPGSLQTVSSRESKQLANSFSFYPDATPADNEHDFAMIINYLDNVFPLQFYFYQPSSLERDPGWLLSLLRLLTALSLSCL
jgi:C6 transcription factor Pro1